MPQLSRTPDASYSVAELSQQTSPASSAGAQGGSFHTTRAQQTVRSMSARREEERQAKLGAIKTRKEASSNEVAEVAQAEALRVEAERVTAERAEAELLVQAMAQEAHASDEVARMQQEQRVLEERVASPQRREASQGDVHGMRDELYSQLREALALESQRGAQEFAELMEPELVVTAVRLARQNLEAERTGADEVATEAVEAGRTGADQLTTDAAEAEQVHTIKDAEQLVAAATTEVEEAAAPKAVFEPAGTEIDVTPSLGTVSSLATSVTLVAEVISAGLLAVTGVALPTVAPPVPAVKELEVEHAEKQVGTEEVQPDQPQELQSSQPEQVGTEEVQPHQLHELESSQAEQVGTEEVQPHQLHEPESSQAEQVGTVEVQPHQLHEPESSQAEQVSTEEVQPDQLQELESSQAEQVGTEEVQPDQLHEPESSQAQEVSTEEVQPDHLQELESSQAKQVGTEEVQPHQLHEPESSQAKQVSTEEVQPDQLHEPESSQAKQVGTEEMQPDQLHELESSQPEQVGTEEVQPDQLQELQSSQAKQVGTEEVQPDQLQELESSQAEQVCTQEIQPDQLQEELVSSQRPDTQPPVPSSAVKLEPAVQQELEVAADDEVANVASAADKTHATSEESEMHQERWTGQDNFGMHEAERLEAKRLQAKLAESERLAAEKVEAERFEEERREAVRLDAAHADLARAEEDRQAEEKAAADEAEEERGEAVPLAKKPEGEQSCAVEAAEAEQMAAPPVAPEASAAPVPEAKAAATAGAPPASDPSRRAEEAEPAEPAPETVEIAQSNETDEEDEVPWTPAAVASAELTLSTAEKLVAAVVLASDEDVRLSALDELRQFTNDAYGADAAAIGAAVRAGGAMAVLVSCVDSSSSDLQQTVLSLLGNLLTDVFDRHARKSLALFVEAGGLAALQAGLRADYPVNLFATATLQNITSLDAFETCARLREQKCADELIAMMHATDDAVMKSYVTAVLANLRAQDPEPKSNPAIEEAIRMRRLASIVEMMQTGKAVSTVHRLASRWLVRHRARKAMEAECGAGVVASTEAAAA